MNTNLISHYFASKFYKYANKSLEEKLLISQTSGPESSSNQHMFQQICNFRINKVTCIRF